MRRRTFTQDEFDAFTSWRRALEWRRGEIRRIKRQANKRERRDAKAVIEAERNG